MRNFDYSKLNSIKWDGEILNYISKIGEYKGRQELFLSQKPKVLDTLMELAIIQSTESSNKIEGISTTNTRLKDLVLKKIKPKNRDEEEILGYQDVLSTIHESYEFIPITPEIILQLHRDLFKYSEKSIGGKFKNTQNLITETLSNGERIVRFTPLKPYETEQAVRMICKSYNEEIDRGEVNPLILIPTFIHDFLCIHPFNDGNGRMSRLLTTLLLYKLGYVVGRYISLEEKIEKTKNVYYDVLQKSGYGWLENNEDINFFVKYIFGIILSAYRDFEERVDIFDTNPSAFEQVEQAVARKIGKFTKSEIMELTPSISKSSVENSLKELIERNVIEMHEKGRATYYIKK